MTNPLTKERLQEVCEENHYLAGQLISPTRWVALAQFLFTVGILEGDKTPIEIGYDRRFCYHDFVDALTALTEWKERNYEGKPLNYITEK